MAKSKMNWAVVTGVTGSGMTVTTPTAGGRVDTLQREGYRWTDVAPGSAFFMEAGGSFVDGNQLATDAQGRAVQAGSGDTVVAEALEGSSGAGDGAWVVMVTQS